MSNKKYTTKVGYLPALEDDKGMAWFLLQRIRKDIEHCDIRIRAAMYAARLGHSS